MTPSTTTQPGAQARPVQRPLAPAHRGHEPFSRRLIISWLLLVASLIPLVFGLRQLRRAAHAAEQRQDAALLGFEQTAELVTSGIYRYIRHPMYSSLPLLAWGIFLKL